MQNPQTIFLYTWREAEGGVIPLIKIYLLKTDDQSITGVLY